MSQPQMGGERGDADGFVQHGPRAFRNAGQEPGRGFAGEYDGAYPVVPLLLYGFEELESGELPSQGVIDDEAVRIADAVLLQCFFRIVEKPDFGPHRLQQETHRVGDQLVVFQHHNPLAGRECRIRGGGRHAGGMMLSGCARPIVDRQV